METSGNHSEDCPTLERVPQNAVLLPHSPIEPHPVSLPVRSTYPDNMISLEDVDEFEYAYSQVDCPTDFTFARLNELYEFIYEMPKESLEGLLFQCAYRMLDEAVREQNFYWQLNCNRDGTRDNPAYESFDILMNSLPLYTIFNMPLAIKQQIEQLFNMCRVYNGMDYEAELQLYQDRCLRLAQSLAFSFRKRYLTGFLVSMGVCPRFVHYEELRTNALARYSKHTFE
jgi:hypothetical protein